MMIPAFKVDFSESEKELASGYFHDVLDSGYLTLGPYTRKFENAFTEIATSNHASCVSSGTVALEIILRALDIKGSVLVPANTNYATVAAVNSANLKPILYDSDIYPSVEDIEQRISVDTAAIIIVHIGGFISPDITKIQRLCNKHNIYLIEDAAHAHGATSNAGTAGALGVAAAFSFFPTKVMTTGEGGMITTNDIKLDASVRVYRDQGKDTSGNLNIVKGNSWRMSELHAGLGFAQTSEFSQKLDRRRSILQRYADNLATNPHTRIGGGDFLHASGHKCILIVHSRTERDKLRDHLSSYEINTSKGVYEIPIHRQPVFRDLAVNSYPLADQFSDRHLCLPIWSSMELKQVDEVTAAINSFYATH